MKANAVPRLLSSLVWIDQYNECNGMTSFREFMISWIVTRPQKQEETKNVMLCHNQDSKAACGHDILLYAVVPSACCHLILLSAEAFTSQPGFQRSHLTLAKSCILHCANEENTVPKNRALRCQGALLKKKNKNWESYFIKFQGAPGPYWAYRH